MFKKRSPLSILLLAALAVALAGCGAGATPTATPVSEPAATVAPTDTAAAVPTDTAPPPTDTAEAPTETAAPTDTVAPEATPTQVAAGTPVMQPVGNLPWKQLGLAGKAVQSIALFPSGGNVVVGAGPQGAWRTTYDYTSWEQLSVHPQGRTASAALESPDVIYITSHTGCASGAPITLMRSTDAGKTWQEVTKGAVPLTVAVANNTLAYGTTCSSVVKTTDSGATWTELPGSKLTNYDPATLAVSPDGQIIFAAYYSEGGSARIMRSTDSGASWSDVTPKDKEIRAQVLLQVVPGTQGHTEQAGAYMASSPGLLWFLAEGTNDWKLFRADNPMLDNPAANAPYEITALYVDTNYSEDYPKPGPIVYTARATQDGGKLKGLGVFRTMDKGITWEPVGKGLEPQAANTLVLAPHDAFATPKTVEVLLAGTEDGVWGLAMR
ncbi:MAG: hypothetical protein ACJ78Q_01580 [Chloroflexia bacterium]